MEEVELPDEVIGIMLFYMSISEVLKMSTISKQWKTVCRDHLKIYRTVCATIELPRQSLRKLDEDIFRSLHFVKGIKVIDGPDPRRRLHRRQTHGVLNVRTTTLQFVEVHVSYDICNINDQKYLRAMIVHNSASLVKLTFNGNYTLAFQGVFGFLKGIDGSGVYLLLSTIKLKHNYCVGMRDTEEQHIVAPNLQEIYGICSFIETAEFSSSVVRCLKEVNIARITTRSDFVCFTNAFQNIMNLVGLSYYCRNVCPVVADLYTAATNDVTARNSASLEYFNTCPCRFFSVRENYPLLQFPQVKNLLIGSNQCRNISRQVKLCCRMAYCKENLFPALEHATISMRVFHEPDENDQPLINAIIEDPPATMFSLTMTNFDDFSSRVNRVGSVKDQVTSLTIFIENVGALKCAGAFSMFPRLDILNLVFGSTTLDDQDREMVMDAVLCGMTFEEIKHVKFLRRTNGFNLDHYKYAPVHPCLITSGISSLVLSDSDRLPRTPMVHYLSEFSCRLAIARCPNITITVIIKGQWQGEFRGLRHYVTINRRHYADIL